MCAEAFNVMQTKDNIVDGCKYFMIEAKKIKKKRKKADIRNMSVSEV